WLTAKGAAPGAPAPARHLRAHLPPERSDVHRRPVLDQPAVADPEDVDELEFYTFSGRRQVPELTKVRPPHQSCIIPCHAGQDSSPSRGSAKLGLWVGRNLGRLWC